VGAHEPPDSLAWTDARDIGLEGRGFTDTVEPFDRLPADAEGKVSDAVWSLQRNTAGICVRFHTDAPEIHVRWSLVSGETGSSHMAATGVSGVDLYARLDGRWRFAGVGRPEAREGNTASLPGSPDGSPTLFQVNFPLYNGVTSVEIGVPVGRRIEPVRETERRPPVCFYGTSIVQGGCASRPGMAYPSIIGRSLDLACLNLGFSGSARCEPEIAEILSRLEARAFVLDPLPNMDADSIPSRLGHLVRTLRNARPRAPIVLVEHVRPSRLAPGDGWLKANVLLGKLVDGLRDAGVGALHVVAARDLLGDDGEATVDGIHPTDLGFSRMAAAIGPVLQEALRTASATSTS
jgi:hypothetical protein